MPRQVPKYPRKRPPGSFKRLIVEMPNDEINLVDNWGIDAGMPSRAAAFRRLIRIGLEKEKASDQPASNPDASTTTD